MNDTGNRSDMRCPAGCRFAKLIGDRRSDFVSKAPAVCSRNATDSRAAASRAPPWSTHTEQKGCEDRRYAAPEVSTLVGGTEMQKLRGPTKIRSSR